MSGSSGGGSGSGGGGGYGGGGAISCDTRSIRTQLASPRPSIIAKLKIGDILIVELTPPTGPVQIITTGGDIAGAVLPPDVAKLIECISEGNQYQARIIDINGGNCQVLITHV